MFTYKVVIGGEGGVGKTTFVYRLKHGIFNDDTRITIGVEFCTYNTIVQGNSINIQLWDLGGQSQFASIRDLYAKGASAAIAMYDHTNLHTIERLNEWITLFRKENHSIPILILGTKSDCVTDEIVQENLNDPMIKAYDPIHHIAISSKTGFGIENALSLLANHIVTAPPKQMAYRSSSKRVGNFK